MSEKSKPSVSERSEPSASERSEPSAGDQPQSEASTAAGGASEQSPENSATAAGPTDSAETAAAPGAVIDPASPAAESTAPPPPPKRGKRKDKSSGGGFRWGNFLFGLLVLAALGALGWFQWQHQQRFESRLAALNSSVQAEVDQQLAQVSSSVRDIEQQAATTLQQARAQAEAGNQQSRQLQQTLQQQIEEQTRALQEQMRSLRQQVQAISTTTTDDWKLAEAYYLTRLASQRLLMERDKGSALALMQSADRIVSNYPDPDLYPVREALAEDIAALKLAESVDREGMYLKIAALAEQAEELRVSEPRNFETQPEQASRQAQRPATGAAAEEGSFEAGDWRQAVQQSFSTAVAKLEDFIRVTHHDEPPEPLVAPDRQLYLRSSLQTALDTAQLALLREQPEIYRQSLQKAQSVLNQLYVDSPQRDRLMAELEQLTAMTITQPLPDISESQQALAYYLEQRHRLAPQGEGQAGQQGGVQQGGEQR